MHIDPPVSDTDICDDHHAVESGSQPSPRVPRASTSPPARPTWASGSAWSSSLAIGASATTCNGPWTPRTAARPSWRRPSRLPSATFWMAYLLMRGATMPPVSPPWMWRTRARRVGALSPRALGRSGGGLNGAPGRALALARASAVPRSVRLPSAARPTVSIALMAYEPSTLSMPTAGTVRRTTCR